VIVEDAAVVRLAVGWFPLPPPLLAIPLSPGRVNREAPREHPEHGERDPLDVCGVHRGPNENSGSRTPGTGAIRHWAGHHQEPEGREVKDDEPEEIRIGPPEELRIEGWIGEDSGDCDDGDDPAAHHF
jgi:hypothetical protein